MMIIKIFFAVIIAVWLANGFAGGLLFAYDIWTYWRYKDTNAPFIYYLYAFGHGLFCSLKPFQGLKFVWQGIGVVSNPNRHKEREQVEEMSE